MALGPAGPGLERAGSGRASSVAWSEDGALRTAGRPPPEASRPGGGVQGDCEAGSADHASERGWAAGCVHCPAVPPKQASWAMSLTSVTFGLLTCD